MRQKRNRSSLQSIMMAFSTLRHGFAAQARAARAAAAPPDGCAVKIVERDEMRVAGRGWSGYPEAMQAATAAEGGSVR